MVEFFASLVVGSRTRDLIHSEKVVASEDAKVAAARPKDPVQLPRAKAAACGWVALSDEDLRARGIASS